MSCMDRLYACPSDTSFHHKTGVSHFWNAHIHQTIGVLTDWVQVKIMLIFPRRCLLLTQTSPTASPPDTDMDTEHLDVLDAHVRDALAIPLYRQMRHSTMNTLCYLFYHMRCGLYVMIRNNAVQMFVPFCNTFYRNTWVNTSFKHGDRHSYYHTKPEKENVIPDVDEWWSNGGLVCNVRQRAIWGDHYLANLRHMLESVCAHQRVANAEFFLNKRDWPQLRVDGRDPCPQFFPPGSDALRSERFDTHCPIFSFYTREGYADVGFPTPYDWKMGTREKSTFGYHAVPWEDRVPTAIFRGSASGSGVTIESNQRLHAAYLSHCWGVHGHKYSKLNLLNDGYAYMNAGLTSWNLRDKKHAAGGHVAYICTASLPFDLKSYMSFSTQCRFKYMLYIDGHCSASRYSEMMVSGCVILRVSSPNAHWFTPLLRAGADHLAVKEDLSDLAEVIHWCKTHDAECARIARCAYTLARSIFCRDSMERYCAMAFNRVAGAQSSVDTQVDVDYTPRHSGYPLPTTDHTQCTRSALAYVRSRFG